MRGAEDEKVWRVRVRPFLLPPKDRLTDTHTSNINAFGLSCVVAFSLLVALIDITLLRFLIYLSRFRRALGPRIVRWTQDGVWQLQRRAYEGEGHKKWTDLESEIPLMEKGEVLKDLPIMWLLGKSPMMTQNGSFVSTSNLVSNEVREEEVLDAETVGVKNGRGKSWFGFWRRNL